MNRKANLAALVAIANFASFAVPAFAHESTGAQRQGVHGDRANMAKEQQPWGIAGETRHVRRTIRIAMTDDMRFTPADIEVRLGETVRFIVQNKGKVLHEMVIGTRQALDEHAAMMQRFPGMEHDEPHMAHVSAGRSGNLVWHFNRVGDFDFACLIPGHYQAGMVGKIKVLAPGQATDPTQR